MQVEKVSQAGLEHVLSKFHPKFRRNVSSEVVANVTMIYMPGFVVDLTSRE
jgi:hypothetical protein